MQSNRLSLNECCYPFSLEKFLSSQYACWAPYNVCLRFTSFDIDSNLVEGIKKKIGKQDHLQDRNQHWSLSDRFNANATVLF